MKDYTLPKNNKASVSLGNNEKTKPRGDLPTVIRVFFPICLLLLVLKLTFHLPEFRSLPPQTVNIQGARILSENDVRQFLNLPGQIPWFSLDPYEMSLELIRHPWIETAVIHRSVPLTIDVHITERTPIAFIQTTDQLFLLGNDYKILKRLSSNGAWDLPIIVNRGLKGIMPGDRLEPRDLKRAFQLLALLKGNKDLPLDSVSEIIITDPFNLVIVASPKGMRIKFGFENFERKLASLARLMPLISKNLKRIRYIDLRSIHGATVKYN